MQVESSCAVGLTPSSLVSADSVAASDSSRESGASRRASSSSASECRLPAPRRRGWRRDDFKVHSLLGEGVLSRVYLAHNIHTAQKVAIKIIQKHKVVSNAVLQSILRERIILSSLGTHPNFIWLICSFQDEKCLYFVLELAPGGSLCDCFTRYENRLSQSLGFYWACDIINILTHLRYKAIAHRDIKPDNLLLDDQRRLRLIDFNSAVFVTDMHNDGAPAPGVLPHNLDAVATDTSGSADRRAKKENGRISTENASPHSEIFGSLPYLPPEILVTVAENLFAEDPVYKKQTCGIAARLRQLKKAASKGSWTPYAIDIWACGCVLFEIFCGYHPFRGQSDVETALNILSRDSLCFPLYLDASVTDLLGRMLQRRPEERLGMNDIEDLRQHVLFSHMGDLGAVPYNVDRPSFQDGVRGLPNESKKDMCNASYPVDAKMQEHTSSEETSGGFDASGDALEFTPDIGCSFGRIVSQIDQETGHQAFL